MNEVDKYLNDVNPPMRVELKKIRALVKDMVPEAVEGISYKMPGFKYKGKYFIGYAAFKNHMSIFPAPEAIDALSEKLKDFQTSKGTIQFTLERPLPQSLLKEIILLRKGIIDQKEK